MGYSSIESIDRQIEELQRRRELILSGTCYSSYVYIHDEIYNHCGPIHYTSLTDEMENRNGNITNRT